MAHLEENPNQEEELNPVIARVITSVMYTGMHPLAMYQIIANTADIHPYLKHQNLKFGSPTSLWNWVSKRENTSAIWKGNFIGILWCEKFILEESIFKKFRNVGILPEINSKYDKSKLLNVFLLKTAAWLGLELIFFPLERCLVEVCADLEPIPKYYGALDGMWNILTKTGIRQIYTGFSWRILSTLIKGSFAALNYRLGIYDHELHVKGWGYFFTSFLEILCCYPFDVISTRAMICGDGLMGIRDVGTSQAIEVMMRGLHIECGPKMIHFMYFLCTKNWGKI